LVDQFLFNPHIVLDAFCGNKLVVSACFQNWSLVENYNFVHIFDCTQAVCNDDHGSVAKAAHGFLNFDFSDAIQAAGCFVEYNYFAVPENAACDAQALFLPAWQSQPPLPHWSVKHELLPVDEIHQFGFVAGIDYIFFDQRFICQFFECTYKLAAVCEVED